MDHNMDDRCKCVYIITIALIAVIVIFLKTSRKVECRTEVRRGVLLTGLPGAGKSRIFNQLMNLYYRESTPSTEEEIGDYDIYAQLSIIDLPGRDDIRQVKFNLYRKIARAVIFVIDSVTLPENVTNVATLLYDILLDTEIRYKQLPVLIVCNKQDVRRAMDHMTVKTMLEKEITVVRARKVNDMRIYDPYLSRYTFHLGKRNEEFKFCHLENQVDIVDCSALPIDNFFTYMDDVKTWLNQLGDLYIDY